VDVNTLIERREFKYLLPVSQIPALRRSLAGICTLDRYAGPDRRYTIRSLYLDSPDLALYQANVREDHDRIKVRVRGYPGAAGAPLFLEVKRRTGDVIRKTRVQVSAASWPALLQADPRDLSPRAAAFCDLVRLRDLQPTTIVEYDREAWVSELDDYGRVTFDLAIGSLPPDGWNVLATPGSSTGRTYVDHGARTLFDTPMCVLEVKFAGPAPRWMSALIERHELIRYAFSKYGGSVVEQRWAAGARWPVSAAMGA
jgi:hypothetical protein